MASRTKLPLSTALALAVLFAGCAEDPAAPSSPTPVRARLATAEATTLAETLVLHGTVAAARTAVVSTRVSGTVLRVHVEAGDSVSQGSPLLDIDPQVAGGQLAAARGALARPSRRRPSPRGTISATRRWRRAMPPPSSRSTRRAASSSRPEGPSTRPRRGGVGGLAGRRQQRASDGGRQGGPPDGRSG
jgi:membrane fusion protein, multidrug efflux system